ncbi:hypothetical protein JCM3770_000502 [Rhodotorula araucariae]
MINPPHPPAAAAEPLGRHEEALLHAVDVTPEDKQNGYDVSLLSLQPRGTHIPPATDAGHGVYMLKSDTQETLPYAQSTERDADDASNEWTPLAPSFSHASIASSRGVPPRASRDSHRSYLASVPPVGVTPNPRFAAQAYRARAEATAAGDAEKAGRATAASGRALWQRKGLLLALVVLILVVCAGVGIGVGVGVGVLRGKGDAGAALAAPVSSTEAGTTMSPDASTTASPAAVEVTATADPPADSVAAAMPPVDAEPTEAAATSWNDGSWTVETGESAVAAATGDGGATETGTSSWNNGGSWTSEEGDGGPGQWTQSVRVVAPSISFAKW